MRYSYYVLHSPCQDLGSERFEVLLQVMHRVWDGNEICLPVLELWASGSQQTWFCPWLHLAMSEGVLLNTVPHQTAPDASNQTTPNVDGGRRENVNTTSTSPMSLFRQIIENCSSNATDSAGPGGPKKLCVSDKLLDGVHAAGPGLWITVWVARN